MNDPNDVLVRLRAFYTSETCREAADEIERLRARVAELESERAPAP